MKKIICLLVSVFALSVSAFCQDTVKKSAETLKREALNQEVIQDSITYLKNNMNQCATSADKRSLLFFLGNLQEQLGLYTDAGKSYASAAGISAADAKNMPKVSSEELVLRAVKACLNSGDWETANSYLNSAVRNSKNETTIAWVNIYSIWSSLCRAASYSEIQDSIALLKAYVSMDSMKSVKNVVLFTLWYVTGESSYGTQLQKEFPLSPEAAISKGNAQIASVPFWYFVPRADKSGLTQVESSNITSSVTSVSSAKTETGSGSSASKTTAPVLTPAAEKAPSQVAGSSVKAYEREKKSGVKEQLGLFREEKNARELIDKVRAKGFDAYFYKETRASGTTYCIVVVDEDSSKSLGSKLKASGFDCYPVN